MGELNLLSVNELEQEHSFDVKLNLFWVNLVPELTYETLFGSTFNRPRIENKLYQEASQSNTSCPLTNKCMGWGGAGLGPGDPHDVGRLGSGRVSML